MAERGEKTRLWPVPGRRRRPGGQGDENGKGILSAAPANAAWLDAGERAAAVVCEMRGGRCLQMSPSAYWLFQQMGDGLAPDEISDLIAARFGQQIAAGEIARACAELLGRVEEEDQAARARERKRYAFRIRLVSERTVGRIARVLEPVLSLPGAAAYAVLLAVAVLLLVLSDPFHSLHGHLNSSGGLAIAYLAYLLALGAHELGHATACSRYRVRPGDIGFAVYLILPAVYCDVNRAWLLPRRQRVIVDISGLLFETALGSAYVIAGSLFHAWILALAAVMVLGNLIWVLNPFGRFDLYWTLTDVFGVTNLRKESWRALRGMFHAGRQEPDTATVRTSLRIVFAGYAIGMALFFGWFGYNLVIMLPYLAGHIQAEGTNMIGAAGRGNAGEALRSGLGFVLPVAIFAIIYYRMSAIFWPAARKLVVPYLNLPRAMLHGVQTRTSAIVRAWRTDRANARL